MAKSKQIGCTLSLPLNSSDQYPVCPQGPISPIFTICTEAGTAREPSLIMIRRGLEGKLKISQKISWPLNKFSFIFIAQQSPQKLLSKKWVHEHVVLKAQQAVTKGYCERQLGVGVVKPQQVQGRTVMGFRGQSHQKF